MLVIAEILKCNGKIYGYSAFDNGILKYYTKNEMTDFIRCGNVLNAAIAVNGGDRISINDKSIEIIDRKPVGVHKEVYDRSLAYQRMLQARAVLDNQFYNGVDNPSNNFRNNQLGF